SVVQKGNDVHKRKKRSLCGSQRKFSLPVLDQLFRQFPFNRFKEQDMVTLEPFFYRRSLYLFLIIYVKKLAGPVITSDNLAMRGIHCQASVQVGIIDRINKMFLL